MLRWRCLFTRKKEFGAVCQAYSRCLQAECLRVMMANEECSHFPVQASRENESYPERLKEEAGPVGKALSPPVGRFACMPCVLWGGITSGGTCWLPGTLGGIFELSGELGIVGFSPSGVIRGENGVFGAWCVRIVCCTRQVWL